MAIKFLNTVAVDTDVLYVDASNNRVGIGTDSPNHELVVQGTSSPNIELKNSNYSDGGFVLNRTNYNQQWKWWAQSSQMYFGFSTNESTYSNKMTIQSGGNVGIGTTSPAAKLEVEQSNSGTGTVFLSNSYNNKGFRTGNAGYATFSGYQDGNNTTSGNAYGALIGLNTFYNGTSFYNDNQYVDPSSILFKDGDIKFHTNDISATGNFTPNERLRITKTGNVGIGTTSPATKLHVFGTTSSMPSLGAAPSAAQLGGLTYGTLFSTLTSGRGVIQQGRSDGTSLSFDLLLQPVGGNVGIGTSIASQKLHVAGNARVTGAYYDSNNSAGTSGQVLSSTATGTDWVSLSEISGVDGTGTTNYVAKWSDTDTITDSTIYDDGTNVGIGTPSPGYKLEVNGTFSSNAIWTTSSSLTEWGSGTTAYGTLTWDIGYAKIFANSGNQLQFAAGGASTDMTIDTSGNVGIGTTSPDSKLHVKEGDITIEGFNTSRYLRFIEPDGSFQGGYVNYDGGSNILKIGVHNANDTNTANDTDAISIPRSSGNVGIGTTSPGEKLEVNGTVKATAATDAYKGYIKNTITCTPLMKTANTDYNYIPYNSTIFGSTPAYYNRMAAAYDGRVKKIILRHVDGVTPTATGMKFKKEVNGTVSTTEYTATVTGGASANFTAIYNFANSDFTFSEGDSIAILAQTSGGTGSIGGVSVQIIVEYNIT